MTTTVSPSPHILLQCDLATFLLREGVYFSFLNQWAGPVFDQNQETKIPNHSNKKTTRSSVIQVPDITQLVWELSFLPLARQPPYMCDYSEKSTHGEILEEIWRGDEKAPWSTEVADMYLNKPFWKLNPHPLAQLMLHRLETKHRAKHFWDSSFTKWEGVAEAMLALNQ